MHSCSKTLLTCVFFHYNILPKLFNPIQTGGGGAFEATPDSNFLLLTNDCVYSVFLLRDFSSNLPGNMGLINKVDMVCLSPVGYGV